MLAGQMTPLRQALGFGAVRWSLGLVLGLLVFARRALLIATAWQCCTLESTPRYGCSNGG
jgi:hypothetical protein